MAATYAVEALRTITASRWELLCGRLFGRRYVSEDDDVRVVFRRWRGKLYMMDWTRKG